MQNRVGLQNPHQERAPPYAIRTVVSVMRNAWRKGTDVGMHLQKLVKRAFADTEEIRAAQKFYVLLDPAPPEKQRAIESPKWEMQCVTDWRRRFTP